MFESVGELVVVSMLLGVTVFAFLYLGWRGARDKRMKEKSDPDGDRDSSRNSPTST